MRQTEQFSLKWADVNLERGLITLPVTKAGDVQYVPLNDEAKQILEGLTVGNRSVWVFPGENPDTYLDPRNFYDRVWIYMQRWRVWQPSGRGETYAGTNPPS